MLIVEDDQMLAQTLMWVAEEQGDEARVCHNGRDAIATARAIQPDLVVVDMELEQTVTSELCQSAQDHCPFEGESVKGWPVTTLVRGTPRYVDGKVASEFPGEYVKRE